MPVQDDLGTRMKTFYEQIPKTKLMRRTPVVIRIDGKAFHTFTKGFQKPFDKVLIKSMQETMKYLCENIQGCVLGYTQSDEITLILVDYKKLTSSAWFDYEVQKMCSVAASMATMAFNKFFIENVYDWWNIPFVGITKAIQARADLYDTYLMAVKKGAMFDARCFNIPKEEVTNLIYWRQLDAIRNSIQMVGQANFSHNELQNKSCDDIQNMLMAQKDINWNDFPTAQKRGSCCAKNKIIVKSNDDGTTTAQIRNPFEPENEWIIDTYIPIFKGGNREYIDKLVYIGEE